MRERTTSASQYGVGQRWYGCYCFWYEYEFPAFSWEDTPLWGRENMRRERDILASSQAAGNPNCFEIQRLYWKVSIKSTFFMYRMSWWVHVARRIVQFSSAKNSHLTTLDGCVANHPYAPDFSNIGRVLRHKYYRVRFGYKYLLNGSSYHKK